MTDLHGHMPYEIEVPYGALPAGHVDLQYQPDDNPYAIRFLFEQPGAPKDEETVPWLMSRDLLLEGFTSEFWRGEGNLEIRRANQKYLALKMIHSETKSGRTTVLIVARTLKAFINRTLAEVPQGKETERFDWSELEEEIASW